jgi:hypothetical protein
MGTPVRRSLVALVAVGAAFCAVVRTTVATTGGQVDLQTVTIILAPSSPGDDDGFADAGETIDMPVTLLNHSGLDLADITVELSTNDSKLECITVPVVPAGSVPVDAGFTTPPFRFKVAAAPVVQRTTVDEVLRAEFRLTLRANDNSLTQVIEVVVDLDLDVIGGTPPTSPFVEDFEGTTLGTFTLMTLDAGRNSMAASDGSRCQYNDPCGPNIGSCPNRADCFLGFPGDPPSGVNDWHVQRNDAANCNSGRAYTGVQSLRWGLCPPTATTAARDTTRFKQLDAVGTIDPINLPSVDAAPELTFKHQVSFLDNRLIGNIPPGHATDRGIVQVQLADASGNPVGNWLKITAYVNAYDQQGTDNYVNCTFDPVDDGNDEDDFFDPADPLRRLGPSSTCFPEFAYARSGHTDWRLDFHPNNIGLAVDGPGLPGNQDAGFRNPGTWVEPRFDLTPFATRRIRLRFLATSIELGNTQTAGDFVAGADTPVDDGWFIDDVRVMTALATPIEWAVDGASFAGLPCPQCTFGQIIRVDKGHLAFPEPDAAVTVNWPVSATVDLVGGNLASLRTSGGNYTGTVSACLRNDAAVSAIADGSDPGSGGATYFLVRHAVAPFCGQAPGYTTNHLFEAPGRDAEIAADGDACP